MTGSFKVRPKVGVIEDLPVVGDPEGAVLVSHRLLTGREVDNAQAAMAQSCVSLNVEAVSIGTAMRDPVGHPADDSAVRGAPIGEDGSRDSAHKTLTLAQRWFVRGFQQDSGLLGNLPCVLQSTTIPQGDVA
jgi:hypothetical protein